MARAVDPLADELRLEARAGRRLLHGDALRPEQQALRVAQVDELVQEREEQELDVGLAQRDRAALALGERARILERRREQRRGRRREDVRERRALGHEGEIAGAPSTNSKRASGADPFTFRPGRDARRGARGRPLRSRRRPRRRSVREAASSARPPSDAARTRMPRASSFRVSSFPRTSLSPRAVRLIDAAAPVRGAGEAGRRPEGPPEGRSRSPGAAAEDHRWSGSPDLPGKSGMAVNRPASRPCAYQTALAASVLVHQFAMLCATSKTCRMPSCTGLPLEHVGERPRGCGAGSPAGSPNSTCCRAAHRREVGWPSFERIRRAASSRDDGNR